MSGNRHCARPGCGGSVAALLSYDYAGQRIWLDDPGAESGGHHSALCAAHASRLRAPKGWSCQDRRTHRPPAAFLVPSPAVANEPRPTPPPAEVVPAPVDPAAFVAEDTAEAMGSLPGGAQVSPPRPDQAPQAAVPPQRDGGIIAGLTAIAV
jgi:hypothetical protein